LLLVTKRHVVGLDVDAGVLDRARARHAGRGIATVTSAAR
jgi:hypothetical protein